MSKPDSQAAESNRSRKVVEVVSGRLLDLLNHVRRPPPKAEAEADGPTLFWGLRHLPFSDATQRFLVVGSPGSGKTTVLELLMRSVLGYVVTPGFDQRALIYDPKRDTLPLLAGMGLSVETADGRPPEVRTLNPFDARGFAWDLAKDVDCPAAALQVATILIPEEVGSTQPFFSDAARHMLYAVMLSFLANDVKNWTLRHLIMVLKNETRLRSVLANSWHTEDLAAAYFGEEKLKADIISTIDTKVMSLEIVAALWENSRKQGRTVSLADWARRDGRCAFAADAILDLPAFVDRLTKSADSDPVSKHLNAQLSDSTRKSLAYSGDKPPDTLPRLLANDLDRILKKTRLYDPDRFKQIQLSAVTRRLLAQEPVGADLVRLNRLLLEDAYPQVLSRDHGNFILVLGSHPSNRAALEAINKAIFRRITDLLLTQQEEHNHGVTGRKTWLFLDEVRHAGKLDGLSSLLNQGRSKGVCCVLGFQDIEGMRHVYKDQVAHEIVGQCDNKTVLRTESYPTAKWAEEHFGQALIREYTVSESESRSPQGTSRTWGIGEHVQLRSAVLASEFMTLPRTGQDRGLLACNDLPLAGAYWAGADWPTIMAMRSRPLAGRSYARFAAGELENPAALVARLLDKDDPVSGYLMTQFSDSAKRQFLASSGGTLDGQRIGDLLVAELNKVLADDSFYDRERFDQVKLRPTTLSLLQQPGEGERLLLCNRLLLEDAFPKELRKEVLGEDPQSTSVQFLHRWTDGDQLVVCPPKPDSNSAKAGTDQPAAPEEKKPKAKLPQKDRSAEAPKQTPPGIAEPPNDSTLPTDKDDTDGGMRKAHNRRFGPSHGR